MKTSRTIIHIILMLSLVFSTVGVTVVGMACAGTPSSASCPSCAGKQSKMPKAGLVKAPVKKSCCEKYQKHLALRADFVRPAVETPHHYISAILPFVFMPKLVLRTFDAMAATSTSPPAAFTSAPDLLTLNATFRI